MGTRDLALIAQMEPLAGFTGATSLVVQCIHGGDVLVAAKGGAINQTTRSARIGSAQWEWGGDPEGPQTQAFKSWVQVRGALECDIEVLLTNSESSSLGADIQYSWKGIEPCPDHVAGDGCEKCPTNVCEDGEVAQCDGGKSWICAPVTSTSTATTARATSSAEATSSPSTTAGPQLAALRLRIDSISFEALTGKQQDAVEQAVVKVLAKSLSVPADNIKDLDGNAGHLSLSQGSLVVQGSIDLPAGTTMASVQDSVPSAAGLIARSISQVDDVQDAVAEGGAFAGEADEVDVCISDDADGCPDVSGGGTGPGVLGVILWVLVAVLALAALVAGAVVLLPRLKAMRSAQPGQPTAALSMPATAAGWLGQLRSRLSRAATNGDHAHPQTPERGISGDYASSAHDEERQRLIPSGSAHVPSSSAQSHASGRLPAGAPSPGAKSNSSRRLGKGWPPGYEPLQREGGAGA